MTRLVVIVRTFNEERNIARTLESVMLAVRDFDAEIVLADCLSIDCTIAIARKYPITIVQLASANDRSPAAGWQLGFQISQSEYMYLLDGDMQLHRKFLEAAMEELDKDPALAGVGGLVRHANLVNMDFKARELRGDPHMKPGIVDRLNGGGLFRRRAVDYASYLGDRNLHGLEELELALRLRNGGWNLKRLPITAVDHHDHTESDYWLLWRRLRSRHAACLGELIRAAIGKPYFREILWNERIFHLTIMVYLWLGIIIVLGTSGLQGWVAALTIFVFPMVVMAFRRKSVWFGIYSVVQWSVYALGTIHGLLSCRIDPRTPVAYRVLKGNVEDRRAE